MLHVEAPPTHHFTEKPCRLTTVSGVGLLGWPQNCPHSYTLAPHSGFTHSYCRPDQHCVWYPFDLRLQPCLGHFTKGTNYTFSHSYCWVLLLCLKFKFLFLILNIFWFCMFVWNVGCSLKHRSSCTWVHFCVHLLMSQRTLYLIMSDLSRL